MSVSDFYTFLTGGLGLLIALLVIVAWTLWRMHADARAGRASALSGVGHELRINLQRMVSELAQVAANRTVGPDVLLPIRHPQLDGVNSSLINTNRNGIAILGSTYQELESRKLSLRAMLAQGREPGATLDDAMDAAINGIAALYIWEVHAGARPDEVGRVRSWDVRDWMKGHRFKADAFPGMHLRDEVVERLRVYGLTLTPRPLTHTAYEYYSMHYDRMADKRAPFGQRSLKLPPSPPADPASATGGGGLPLGSLFGRPKKDEDVPDAARAAAEFEALEAEREKAKAIVTSPTGIAPPTDPQPG